jgi:hypothetical protein
MVEAFIAFFMLALPFGVGLGLLMRIRARRADAMEQLPDQLPQQYEPYQDN